MAEPLDLEGVEDALRTIDPGGHTDDVSLLLNATRALIAEVRRLREWNDDAREANTALAAARRRDVSDLEAKLDSQITQWMREKDACNRYRTALECIADWGCDLAAGLDSSQCNLDQIKIAREALKEPQP